MNINDHIEIFCKLVEKKICEHYGIELGNLYYPVYRFENTYDEKEGFDIIKGKIRMWLGIAIEEGSVEDNFYVCMNSLELNTKETFKNIITICENNGSHDFLKLKGLNVNLATMRKIYDFFDNNVEWVRY